MESKNPNQAANSNTTPNPSIKDFIIDLPKLSMQSEIKNSDVILAILEICTFNKKYNYDCSNNTKAFWDRVVQEEILQKIFKINNPVFKLLPLINAIAYYIQTDETDFEEFFSVFNAKNKKNFSPQVKKGESKEKNSGNLLGNKRQEPDKDQDEIDIQINEEENNDKKKCELKQPILVKNDEEKKINERMLDLDDVVNKMMKISKFSREEVLKALYGTSYNIKNAFLYLKNNKKYENYFFQETDDLIIKQMKHKKYYIDLVDDKGIELVEERKKFLGIK